MAKQNLDAEAKQAAEAIRSMMAEYPDSCPDEVMEELFRAETAGRTAHYRQRVEWHLGVVMS